MSHSWQTFLDSYQTHSFKTHNHPEMSNGRTINGRTTDFIQNHLPLRLRPVEMSSPSIENLETYAKTYNRLQQPPLSVGPRGKSEDRLQEQLKNAPLFTWEVKLKAETGSASHNTPSLVEKTKAGPIFKQYGLIGFASDANTSNDANHKLFINANAPSSTFICGSQGSGKSYTMSCMLENYLIPSTELGELSQPLTAMICHYDIHGGANICESAYLSSHIPTTIFVSPTNYFEMKRLYDEKLPKGSKHRIVPLLFSNEHLNTTRLLQMMAFTDNAGSQPLYVASIHNILKNMVIDRETGRGINYKNFKRLLDEEKFAPGQRGPLDLRLSIMDGFMDTGLFADKLKRKLQQRGEKTSLRDNMRVKPGELLILDLSDPFLDSASACTLFEMCQSVFLEDTSNTGKVIALDEAHKFMDQSSAAERFTASLLTLIREQRHKGARVLISTQEPTISPALLDLCSTTIVHGFTSSVWFRTLKEHLPATSTDAGATKYDSEKIFNEILELEVGQSLVFSRTAAMSVSGHGEVEWLGRGYVKMQTRKRITADGGKSILASEAE